MINIILEPALLLGVIFALIMTLFYSLRFVKPELATDGDIFVVTLGLIYSSILIIHGWRLDPILLFSQLLVILIALSFYWTVIRQREIIRQLIHFFKLEARERNVNSLTNEEESIYDKKENLKDNKKIDYTWLDLEENHEKNEEKRRYDSDTIERQREYERQFEEQRKSHESEHY